MSEHKDFWITISTIAATLAGFTLASYSIFITRTEMAASDPICRRYNFKECTSSYSLCFMFFALIMFISPLLLGLLFLSRLSISDVYRVWVLVALGSLALIVICIAVFVQGRYVWRGIQYYRLALEENHRILSKIQGRSEEDMKELNDQMEITKKKIKAHKRKAIGVYVGLGSLYSISLGLLIITAAYIFVALSQPDWYLTAVVINIYPNQASILSLVFGVILICCYFYVFQPERFLFKRDEATDLSLDNIVDGITKQRKSLEVTKEWLDERIEQARHSVKSRHLIGTYDHNSEKICEGVSISKTEVVLNRVQEYVKGESHGLVKALGGLLSEESQTYHTDWITFCKKRKVITYDGIILIMNGINLYIDGLSKLEAGLKEIPGQLQLLTDTPDDRTAIGASVRNSNVSITVTQRPRESFWGRMRKKIFGQ